MTQQGEFTSPAENALNWASPHVQQAIQQRPDFTLPPPAIPQRMRQKIWAPQYVIQASPLTKLFMPEWSRRCLLDTSLLTDPAATFEVRIARPMGGIVLQHNVPVHVSQLFAQQDTREVTQDEVTPLVHWLCGGPEGNGEECDIYGVVSIDVGMDVTADIVGMLTAKVSMKAIREKQDQIIEQIQKRIVETRDQADAKVKRALKATYNNVIDQWKRIKEDGGGVYAPSVSEALSAHILHAEIKAYSATTKAAFDMMENSIGKPVGI